MMVLYEYDNVFSPSGLDYHGEDWYEFYHGNEYLSLPELYEKQTVLEKRLDDSRALEPQKKRSHKKEYMYWVDSVQRDILQLSLVRDEIVKRKMQKNEPGA